MSSLYDILNINKDAEPETIKKAYKKMAMKYHPDRNPKNKEESEKKFKEVAKAYEILSDEKKRKLYDEYGEQGLEGNMGGQSPFDIFEKFFGGAETFGGMNFGRGGMPFGNFFGMNQEEDNDIKIPVDITFKDIINGTSKKINYHRKVKCLSCNGCGSCDSKYVETCNVCNGKGIVNKAMQIGPGMFTQSSSKCPKCNGDKKYIPDDKKCKECNGKCFTNSKETYVVTVPKGAKHGDSEIIEEKGNQGSSKIGNLVILFKENDTSPFMRKNNSLIFKKEILLSESLCGFEFILSHPNGKKIVVKSDSIVKQDDIKMIPGLGFPIKDSIRFGDLIIQFSVIYPETIDTEKKNLLYKLLPKRDKLKNTDELNEYFLQSFIDTDDEEEEEAEAEGIQCAQQ